MVVIYSIIILSIIYRIVFNKKIGPIAHLYNLENFMNKNKIENYIIDFSIIYFIVVGIVVYLKLSFVYTSAICFVGSLFVDFIIYKLKKKNRL